MIDAFRVAALGMRGEIALALRQAARGSAPARLLGAVLSQYDGDLDSAIRQLRSLVARDPSVAPYAADLLAPIMIWRGGYESELSHLVEILEKEDWRASATIFRAFHDARTGATMAAARNFESAFALLDRVPDSLMRLRLESRLALVAFFLARYDLAMRLAVTCAADASRLGAGHMAAAPYSVAYNIQMDVTGDMEQANRYAQLWRDAAERSGNISFVHAALAAEFELAVQSADDARAMRLLEELRRRELPPQYGEHFALTLAEAMFHAARDLRAFASRLEVLSDDAGRSRGERALCQALVALARAALFDDGAARQRVRDVSRTLGRARKHDPAYERRYRRLARVSVAAACALLGDHVRGQRTLEAIEIKCGQGEERLLALASCGRATSAPRWQRGFALLLQAAFHARRSAEPPVPLTLAQLDVLRLLNLGYDARRIAIESGRSVNTVYNHTRAILAKFGAKRSGEALAMARRNGMLS